VPKPTDLSGLSKEIKALDKTIKAIPKTVIPEQPDLTSSFKSLEAMIKGRTHKFKVEREPFGDRLIKMVEVETE
jgi:hypothetical protein